MNVFVLCTGRTGSVTFANACTHIDNYTTGHETRVKLTGADRLAYPGNHIEVDNRLIWFSGRLEELYGKEAFYVHLTRNPEKVARSFNQRWENPFSIIRAYAHAIHFRKINELSETEKLDICRYFVENTNKNISDFLADKPLKTSIDIDQVAQEFPAFWEAIGASGNLEKAVQAFSEKLNSQDMLDRQHKKSRRWWHRPFK